MSKWLILSQGNSLLNIFFRFLLFIYHTFNYTTGKPKQPLCQTQHTHTNTSPQTRHKVGSRLRAAEAAVG